MSIDWPIIKIPKLKKGQHWVHPQFLFGIKIHPEQMLVSLVPDKKPKKKIKKKQ